MAAIEISIVHRVLAAFIRACNSKLHQDVDELTKFYNSFDLLAHMILRFAEAREGVVHCLGLAGPFLEAYVAA